MKSIDLKIITPERVILEEKVLQVTLPTKEGEITILPGHIPLISAISSGEIVAIDENKEQVPLAVSGGFIEFHDDELAVLADFAESISGQTEESIERARERAREIEKMKKDQSEVDYEHFTTELERSLTLTRIADKWRTKKYRK